MLRLAARATASGGGFGGSSQDTTMVDTSAAGQAQKQPLRLNEGPECPQQ